MAVPKRKISKSRRDKRRTHWKTGAPNLTTCPECGGSGHTPDEEDCPECQGKQRVVETVTLNVDIPSGVADQYSLRIPNEGGAGRNGGPPARA